MGIVAKFTVELIVADGKEFGMSYEQRQYMRAALDSHVREYVRGSNAHRTGLGLPETAVLGVRIHTCSDRENDTALDKARYRLSELRDALRSAVFEAASTDTGILIDAADSVASALDRQLDVIKRRG